MNLMKKRSGNSPGFASGALVGVVGTIVVIFALLLAILFSLSRADSGSSNTIEDLGGEGGASYSEIVSGFDSVEPPSGSVSRDKTDTKQIYYGSERIETADFDTAISGVYALVNDNGGYFSENNSGYRAYGISDGDYRYASMEMRVPEEKFNTVVEGIEAIDGVSVVYKNISAEDVTKAYTSLESSLETAQAKLDDLHSIDRTNLSVTEKLSVLDSISEQAEKVASLKDRIENYDDAITYSELQLTIMEKSPMDLRSEAVGYGNKLSAAFMNGWSGGIEFIGSVILLLARNWLMLALIVFAALFGRRMYVRKRLKGENAVVAEATAPSVVDEGTQQKAEETATDDSPKDES